jgi:hypothetical protein
MVVGVLILVAYAAVLLTVPFVGPGWLFVWELRKGRTLPPFRVERATNPRRYWVCMVAHAFLWVLWILVCAFLALLYVFMQPDFYN